MLLKNLLRACAFALALAPAIATAAPVAPDLPAVPFRIVFDRDDYFVEADATYTQTSESEYEVLTEQGIGALNSTTLNYSASLQKLEILEAATIKNDGRRIDVPAQNIQDREARAGGGPMFSDMKARAIIFPEVAVGDRVRLKVRRQQLQPVFPGHFTMTQVFSRAFVRNDTRVSLSIPQNGPKLNVDVRDVAGTEPTIADGRITWSWRFSNTVAELPDSSGLSPLDYAPRIIASTFADYGEIARAYQERAEPKSRVTANVAQLSKEVTQGLGTEREKAEALYYWVSRNIRFAGNCLGMGLVVPHDVDTILANRLGDCKDHTALLLALLQAAGIPSTPALINSGMSFELPAVPTSAVFDHVINYIPSLDVYADATAKYLRFGDLPLTESGKPVLHTASFDKVRRTPALEAAKVSSHLSMQAQIGADGSAQGVAAVSEQGPFAAGSRSGVAAVPPNMRERLVSNLLTNIGLNGSGEIEFGDPWTTPDPFQISLKFRVDNLLPLPGPGALTFEAPLSANASVASWASAAMTNPEPAHPYICGGGTAVEEFRYEFPAEVEILALPRDVSLNEQGIHYDSTYRRDGQVVTAVRKVAETRAMGLCKPERFPEYKATAQKILKDLKAQVLYR